MSEFDYSTVGGYGPESLPGHSGSETSEEAARHPGVGKKTKQVHEFLEQCANEGATSREVSWRFNWSHGAASGALSRLHRAGLITRLTERRGKQLVYVTHESANGREESHYTPNAAYREDRKPMPLERPEPTLESITNDLLATPIGATGVLRCAHSPAYAEMLAGGILEIVRKYR